MRTARSWVCRSRGLIALLAAAWLALHAAAASAGDGAETAGDVLRVAIPATAFALTYKYDDQPGRRQFYKSFGATVAGTWALKEIVDKERPDGSGSDAFPSGHAATAFQGAAFIHRRYGIKRAWPAYVLATFTAWTRVDADEHDTADVLGGAAIGIASAFVLAKRRDVSVTAFSTGDGFGIRVAGSLR